jgi:hypothetical protein
MSAPAFNAARAVHVQYSRHARETMARRGWTFEDVEAALTRPEVVDDSKHHGADRWRYHRGPLCVVVSSDGKTVITVLLRTLDTWTDADVQQAIKPATQSIHGRDGFTPYAPLAAPHNKEDAA